VGIGSFLGDRTDGRTALSLCDRLASVVCLVVTSSDGVCVCDVMHYG